jgi:hypothetical protein
MPASFSIQHVRAFWIAIIMLKHAGTWLAACAGYILARQYGQDAVAPVAAIVTMLGLVSVQWIALWILTRPFADPGGYFESNRIYMTCDWFPLFCGAMFLTMFNFGPATKISLGLFGVPYDVAVIYGGLVAYLVVQFSALPVLKSLNDRDRVSQGASDAGSADAPA